MRTKLINNLLALALIGATVGAAAPPAAQSGDFRWSGTVAEGNTVEIRGVNGSVRALASEDGLIHVEATRRAGRSDAESVRIEVVEHDEGVTICAVYPSPPDAARANECRPGGGSINVRDNDVEVDFLVRVPAGVRFAGNTVNGNIEVERLRSDVRAATVNGRVSVQTTGFVSRAATVNGDIELAMPAGLNAEFHASTVNGSIDSDFPIVVTGRFGPRTARGTIGQGGRELRVSTVNGSIRLRRN
ncbi:MAG: DUF4097 family beta strand repeat protein [Gemmatimonadetes bacterium]|jgi:hypothetical protein|nr:DUF4097 family beta strand repeat protein [Gemmatimonadota bacterium]